MQLGFCFDQSRCIGCYTCVAACRSAHGLAQEEPDLITLVARETGTFPHVSLSQLFLTCFHCEEPPCVPACPYGIFVKQPGDGVVALGDLAQCTGCGLCVAVCPYEAPRLVSGEQPRVYKCDLCAGRSESGLPIACVASCPVAALEVAPLDDLVFRGVEGHGVIGYPDYRATHPAIVFRSTESAKLLPEA